MKMKLIYPVMLMVLSLAAVSTSWSETPVRYKVKLRMAASRCQTRKLP